MVQEKIVSLRNEEEECPIMAELKDKYRNREQRRCNIPLFRDSLHRKGEPCCVNGICQVSRVSADEKNEILRHVRT